MSGMGRTPEQIEAQVKKEDRDQRERRRAREARAALYEEKGEKAVRMVNESLRRKRQAVVATRQGERLDALRQAGLSGEQAEAILDLP